MFTYTNINKQASHETKQLYHQASKQMIMKTLSSVHINGKAKK